jgi:hypothetical protein
VNHKANQEKYEQLRIQERALDQRISAVENTRETYLLNSLYRQRESLQKQIQRVLEQM